jgi:hypothetical protein
VSPLLFQSSRSSSHASNLRFLWFQPQHPFDVIVQNIPNSKSRGGHVNHLKPAWSRGYGASVCQNCAIQTSVDSFTLDRQNFLKKKSPNPQAAVSKTKRKSKSFSKRKSQGKSKKRPSKSYAQQPNNF